MSDERFGAFGKLSSDFYAQWERGMTAWWDRVLDSPEVLRSLNANLSAGAESNRQARAAGQRWLERLQLPSRDDLLRLLRIATLLEERLLSLEDRLLEATDKVERAEKEAIRARIEAAEARLEASAEREALLARLERLEAALGASRGGGDV